jgi:hypothetical protein
MTATDTEVQLSVPDVTRLSHVQALCDLERPYAQGSDVDALFVDAMNDVLAWHTEHNDFYRRLLERGSPGPRVRTLDDCVALPAIHASFFKTHEVLSIPRGDVALHLTSSGTTGQKSQMFFDAWSIGAAQRMVGRIFEHYGWAHAASPVNYLLFNYEPLRDWKVGTSYTANFLTRFAPAGDVRYALRPTGGGGHEFDVFGAIRALHDYAEQDLPVRIFGFPAFLNATLERMRALGVPPLSLPRGSMAFFGGGWKGHADKAIPKADLYARIEEQLGLPNARIRDGFGSVEHSVPYVECAEHHFHVPVWSRVVIRDLATLAPLPAGEPGFLSFLSAYVTSAPIHSVIMGDLAAWYPGGQCGCGLDAPWFDLLGRAGQGKNRSCAVAAAELLKGSAA